MVKQPFSVIFKENKYVFCKNIAEVCRVTKMSPAKAYPYFKEKNYYACTEYQVYKLELP